MLITIKYTLYRCMLESSDLEGSDDFNCMNTVYEYGL